MTPEERIKLAEAIGWKQLRGMYRWIHDEYDKSRAGKDLPDPSTDANDCEAVIRWLIDTGWRVEIDFPSLDLTETAVRIYNEEIENEWHGYAPAESWKQGVCELALKVLNNDT